MAVPIAAVIPSRAALRLHVLCGFFGLASFAWGYVVLRSTNSLNLTYDTNLIDGRLLGTTLVFWQQFMFILASRKRYTSLMQLTLD